MPSQLEEAVLCDLLFIKAEFPYCRRNLIFWKNLMAIY